MNVLEIRNLTATIDGTVVLENLDLNIPRGELHSIMGKNGMGKSSLAKVIAGHPDYLVSDGEIIFNGEDITRLATDERARKGIFLAFQNPIDVPGVSIANFIRAAMNAQNKKMATADFYKLLYSNMDLLGIDRSFSSRAINVGFSGGEKKRCEMLQILMLQPSFIVLDEIDSGLDIDAMKLVAKSIHALRSDNFSGIIITHYQRLLEIIVPQKIHILEHGKIVRSGDAEMVTTLEKNGYAFFEKNEK